jgi:hypothetical protein
MVAGETINKKHGNIKNDLKPLINLIIFIKF